MTKEDLNEHYRLYRLAFPEKIKSYEQSEKGRARQKRKRQATSYRIREKLYQQSEKGRASTRRYTQSAGARVLRRLQCSLRRARKRNALVAGTGAVIKAIYDRANWLRSQGWDVAVDHIFPLGFGWHEPDNLQIIFAEENHRKHCDPNFVPSVVFV